MTSLTSFPIKELQKWCLTYMWDRPTAEPSTVLTSAIAGFLCMQQKYQLRFVFSVWFSL